MKGMPVTEHSGCPVSRARKPEIQGYRAVRRAAKNYREYSSDVQGDADVRTYRQLPLEADPPRHTQLRGSLMPLFAAEAIEVRLPEFRALALRLMKKVNEAGSADLVADFALPYVMGCLGIVYNRPQDVQEWITWGPNVWLAEIYQRGEEVSEETKRAQRERDYSIKTQRSATVLDAYLERVLAEAHDASGDDRPTDVWQFLTDARPGGLPMTHDELLGTGNVLLAGGRDTVIKLISGFLWHLISSPTDRRYLRDHPYERPAAIAEMARYLSPLPKMERLDTRASAGAGEEHRVLLSFVSANFDASHYPDPERLDLRRQDTSSLAFGLGRHSCLGLQITTFETLALLDALLTEWPDWVFIGDPGIIWAEEDVGDARVRVVDHIEYLRVRTGALEAG